MKLFKSLLVAPATLGLLAPLSATANEVTINDFNPAEELAVTNSRVDGLEARLNNFEAGGFTDTTTMSGTAAFLVGAEGKDGDAGEAAMFEYFYEVDLNTSFTGEDNLNVEFETGNASGSGVGATLDWGSGNGDVLKVTDVNYTFPVGEWTLAVGESMDASATFPNACAISNTVDAIGDCGAGNSVALGGDVSFSASRGFGDGWAVGLGLSSDSGETTRGMFSEEGDDMYGVALGYEADTYGFTVAYSMIESTDLESGYVNTPAFDAADVQTDSTYYGLVGYYSPESTPITFSGGIELTDEEGTDVDKTQWSFGLTTDLGEGTLAATVGTVGAIAENADELMAYDVSYAYPINDSMSITPFAYIVEQSGSTEDTTGFGASVSFSF